MQRVFLRQDNTLIKTKTIIYNIVVVDANLSGIKTVGCVRLSDGINSDESSR
jgi:hypothetical protein